MGRLYRVHKWFFWAVLWLAMGVAIDYGLVAIVNAGTIHRPEHVALSKSFGPGPQCGVVVIRANMQVPVYETVGEWHSNDPPIGEPATFIASFCGAFVPGEPVTRESQADGSVLLAPWQGETFWDVVVLAFGLAGATLWVAAALLRRYRSE